MSSDQWKLSLRQLYGTAEALEDAARAVAASAPAVAPPVVVTVPEPAPTPAPVVVVTVPEAAADIAPPGRSAARLLVSAAVHSALTVGVLLGGFALVDPILPHPERPHLADEVVVVGESSVANRAIPPSAAYQP